jgi:hypothetical protein
LPVSPLSVRFVGWFPEQTAWVPDTFPPTVTGSTETVGVLVICLEQPAKVA